MKMAARVFCLAVLLRLANSQLPYIRICDPVPTITTQTPTVCSNYENIKYIYNGQESLKKTVLQLKMSLESNNDMLERLEWTLKNNFAELTRATESQSSAIQSLRSAVDKLEKRQEGVGENFSEIEQRLNVTEKKLVDKNAKLEGLEMKSEAAFESMKTLLNAYKDDLSRLNSTAQNLEVQLEGRLNVTKVELGGKLDAIEKNTEDFSTKLHNQKTELDHKITSRFNKVIHELQKQNATMNQLIGQTAARLVQLEMETVDSFNDTKTLLETYKNELSLLNLTTRGLEVDLEGRLDATKTDLEQKLQMIEENTEVRIITLEMETAASFNSSKALLNSYRDQISHLNSTTQDLRVHLESRNVIKTDLENRLQTIQLKSEELTRSTSNHKVDISILKNEVDKLEKHQERFGGNFSAIEERLDVAERQLAEKKAKLENLETETEAAFNDTTKLLSSYKKELSRLKSTAHDLEVKVEDRLNVTKMDIEEKLEALLKDTQDFSTKLHNQKTELDHKITSRFNKVIHELQTQNATMNQLIGQTAATVENLETETGLSINSTRTLLDMYKNELSLLNTTTLGLEVKLENRLVATKTDLEKKLQTMEETTEALDTETAASFNSSKALLNSYRDQISHLNSTTQDLKVHLESRLNVTKTDLENRLQAIQLKSEELTRSTSNHKVDISILKNEVDELEKHHERFGGNFSAIEERLDVAERQLAEKKAKLENLETETEAAFNDTTKLLSSYKKELSRLKSTAHDLEVKVEDRLNVIKMDIEEKLEALLKMNEGINAKLSHEKSALGSNIEILNKELKMQNLTVNHLLNQIGVMNKVAFSATIIESVDSFTGPHVPGTSNVLKFDRVFTNVGNAYNKQTGVFTAPVSGIYHFSFMTFGYSSHTSGAILVKNGRYQVSTWEFTGPDASDTTSNSVILEMTTGDCVSVILWHGGKIHTGVFSGFLVFPLV
ncbi:uncharacterized protein LOC129378340 [Poeciliopsis prolifica]|uniref:uncharacterized protein LOC129378340 n=1 Tax=Poeciliopsis prolifica TaxID=188132 RepID=UPI0024144CC1|nr:uncharacterized protein LOC129378340 [Poeciliopsis prolifica]